MKKNLNIAYLNGAEGIIKKTIVSNGSENNNPSTPEIKYYKVKQCTRINSPKINY